MYNGTIKLEASLTDNRIAFQPFTLNPTDEHVQSVELQTQADKIIASVDVTGVATQDDGCTRARSVVETALTRLSYFHQVAIGRTKIISRHFESAQEGIAGLVVMPAMIVLEGQQVDLIAQLGVNDLKAVLEAATHPGERNFGALRSARLSVGSVEEYMHLYAILLELFGDAQNDVDAFIRTVEPNVAQSQHPKRAAGVMETVYTRLRNELAHRRPGADIEQTKKDMAAKVADLRGIVKEAIRLNP
jgi:hypothetical protein